MGGDELQSALNTTATPEVQYFSPVCQVRHEQGQCGVSATASKVKARFWIIGLHRIAKNIKCNCVVCKKLDQKTAAQAIRQLP